MKWLAREMDTYLQAKEYVDTAIVPLIPINWENEIKSTVAMGEFISIISSELERQFQGRVIEFPPFTYLKSESDGKFERLKSWEKALKENDISHIIFITSDFEWEQAKQELTETLIWLPSIPLEHMDHKHKVEVVEGQIKQLIPFLTNKWQNR
ncbi:YpiF family protein [Alkalihalobacterium alkalinitrilicum]|uniref:YpiF family protein n=1 Tax=Alkalihalobacterium alkalinitrilicum TaxID=427920 RepID=UPI000994BA65|nr:YpiF family protein [Alkalihalobacterium alkalinitrilicum]